jgi:hypothetical protein
MQNVPNHEEECKIQRLTSNRRSRRGRKIQSLLTTEVGTIDHVNGWSVLPTNLDVIESIWLEFPASYKPMHAFGLCSAIESASLIIAEQVVATVSGFDLFAFGRLGPHPQLIQLPVVPSGALHITDRGRYKGRIKLHVVLTEAITVGVVLAKRYYNDDTAAGPPPWPMYQFYHVQAKVGEHHILFNPKLRVLQIAVALLDERGQLCAKAKRVSLLLNGVAFDLKLVDPLDPNPKGLYTITFEPFGDVCGPPLDCLVRTSLNLSRVKKSRICIDMCIDAPGCTALVSCIGEAVFLGL